MTPLRQRMWDARTVRGPAERSALEQLCTLRGRLGLRRTPPVWGGADATPCRAHWPGCRRQLGVNTVVLRVIISRRKRGFDSKPL